MCGVSGECRVEGVREPGSGPVLHLLSAEDESLLDGWDAFLFFDALFYPGDLGWLDSVSWEGLGRVYLVVGLDVELDLLAGECADSVVGG